MRTVLPPADAVPRLSTAAPAMAAANSAITAAHRSIWFLVSFAMGESSLRYLRITCSSTGLWSDQTKPASSVSTLPSSTLGERMKPSMV